MTAVGTYIKIFGVTYVENYTEFCF